MSTESLLLDNFTGIVRASDLAELEKGPPGSLFRAENVCFDLFKNAYVSTGYRALSAAISGGPATNVFYSSAIQMIVCTNASGDVYRIHPTTGAITLVQAGAFGAGNRVSWEDWMGTSATLNKVFGADGVSYWEIDSGFAPLDRTGLAPLGAGIILKAHKGHLFSVRPPGRTAIEICPSAANNPLSFSASDIISCIEGGDRINTLSSFNGILRAHKNYDVFNIIGNSFAGTAKDVQKVPLSFGVGGLHLKSAFSYGLNEYVIGYDGFYKFTENSFEHISLALQGILRDRWPGVPYSSFVSFYAPVVGPDAGRKYILFSYTDTDLVAQNLFKYDLMTGEFTEETSYPEQINDIVFSFDHLRTYLAGTKIYYYDNVPLRDATAIRGNLVTNVLDFGHKGIQKAVQFAHNLITDFFGTSIYMGVDGLYPLYSMNDFIDSNNTVVEVPEKVLGGVLSQIRWEKSGGGQPLTNGAFLEYNAYGPRQGRSFSRSRADSVEAIMSAAPLIKSGAQTTTDTVLSYTVTHNLGEKPESVVLAHAGYTMAGTATLTAITRTTFSFTLPSNPGASKTIYWVVVAPGKRLFDAYYRGLIARTVGTTAKNLNHNLNVTPDVVLFTKYDNAGLGAVISSINSLQAVFTPGATSVDAYLSILALKRGTVDLSYFTCGTATSSPITHDLPTTPTAAILVPNQDPVPTHGITSISATQIVYSGSGSYYWAAFK